MILPDGARLGLGAQVKVQSRGDKGSVFACPYCNAVIGEHNPDGSATVLREQHDAPCGLRCAGSASRHWTEGAMHTGPNTCVCCIPATCPSCSGRKVYGRSAHMAARLTDDPAVRELARRDPGARVIVKCPTCRGVGAVPTHTIKKFD